MGSAGAVLLVLWGLDAQIDGGFLFEAGDGAVVLDFAGEGEEGLLDVASVFGADFEEEHIMLVCESFALLLLDFAFGFQVGLGGDEDPAGVLAGVGLDLLDPGVDVLEGLFIVGPVGEDDAAGALVVGLRDVAEPFLAGSVPDLQFDLGVVDSDGFEFEVDADGGHVAVLEDALAELGKQVGLADPAVADNDDLGEEVVLVLGRG